MGGHVGGWCKIPNKQNVKAAVKRGGGPQSGQEVSPCFMAFERGRPQTAAAPAAFGTGFSMGRWTVGKSHTKSSCHLVILSAPPHSSCAPLRTGRQGGAQSAARRRLAADGSAQGLSMRERKGGTPRSAKMPGPAPHRMPRPFHRPRNTRPRGAGRREGAPGRGARDLGFLGFGLAVERTDGTFGRPRPSTKSAGFGAAGPKDSWEGARRGTEAVRNGHKRQTNKSCCCSRVLFKKKKDPC